MSAYSHACVQMYFGSMRSSPQCLYLSFCFSHTHSLTHKGWLICLSQASGTLDIPWSISLKTDTHPISLVQKRHAVPVDVIQKVSQGPFHCGPIGCACTVSYDYNISNHKCPLVLVLSLCKTKSQRCLCTVVHLNSLIYGRFWMLTMCKIALTAVLDLPCLSQSPWA